MSLASILDRAEQLRRESVIGRSRRLPSAPFIPKPQTGWIELETEIEAEFARNGIQWDDIESALAWHQQVLKDRHREWVALMKVCGRCRHCGKPRGPDGTSDLCRRHADARAAWYRSERARLRTAGVAPKPQPKVMERKNAAVAAGLCIDLCGRPIGASSLRPCHRGRRPSRCDECRAKCRTRMAERRARAAKEAKVAA